MKTRTLRWFVYAAALAIVVSLASVREKRPVPAARSISPHEYVDAIEGDSICRPGGRAWAPPGSDAFVIVASATCSACQLTKPFDEEVYRYAKTRSIPVFYVLSDKPENRERERELAADGRNVIRSASVR
jgi:hypothetical protein